MRRESRAQASRGAARGWLTAALFGACCACSAADDPAASRAPGNTGNAANGAASHDAGESAPGFGNAPNSGASSNGAQTGTSGASATQTGARGGRINAAALLRDSCASAKVAAELLPSNLLFVLDRSGSMTCNPPPTTDSRDCEAKPARAVAAEASKWEITSAALNKAIAALPANASIALSYFSNDDECGVNSQPSVPMTGNSSAQRAAVAASLAAAQPGGGTPLVGATILAYKYLHEAALAGRITGNEFVVLITDGAQSGSCSNPPVCTDAASCTDLLADQEVVKAAGPGVDIRTFVIGVPGSEAARGALSRIAKNGGTAPDGCDVQQGNCHFDMTMVPDLGPALTGALMQIAGRTVSCELELPTPASGTLDLGLVNIIYTPAGASESILLFRDTHAGCDAGADGWQYAADNSKIRLCGPTCDAIRADTKARVEVVLGCPAEGPQ